MKVAHLTTVDMSLRFLVLPQLTAVADAGGEVIGISAPGPWVADLEARGIRHVPLDASTRGVDWRSDLKAMVQLWRVLRAERPDILHTHNPKPGVYGRIIGRLAGVPVVVNTVHGLYATEDDRFLKRLIVYTLEAVASRFSDLELFQNPEDLALLRRLHLVQASKAFVLGNGVDLARFDSERFTAAERLEIRTQIVGTDDRPVIGIVGRLVAEKGYPELFEAYASLTDVASLVVVGPDDPTKPDALDREIVAYAEGLGVRFLGMRDDVDRLYQGFDLFVLPSHREGFPRAAMEAAASGLLVVASDIRGCRQVVDHGVNGLLVPVRSPAQLSEALRSLIEDPERRVAMSRAAVEKSRSDFDERNVVQVVMASHRAAWEGKHFEWRMAEIPHHSASTIDRAVQSDAPALAQLHVAGISSGFLSSLGAGFLTHLYRAIIRSRGSVAFVARTAQGRVVGFVAGTEDTSATYRAFLLSGDAVRAVVAAFVNLIRPSVVRGAIETLRYGGDNDSAKAELLSMVVAPEARGQGLGQKLGDALGDWYRDAGVTVARVVVGVDNLPAIRLYESLGYRDGKAMGLHEHSPSLELTWSG